ncbi:MAG: hypothetical protein IT379_36385 [Deltaproteobacteria bacterium]|nr:hypothetical protein [Deltaproteobacteria bacterium]
MDKRPTILSATEAARRLGELLARVRYRQEEFLIRRGRTIVARLGPVPIRGVTGAVAAEAWRGAPHLSSEEARSLELDMKKARRISGGPPRDPWAR